MKVMNSRLLVTPEKLEKQAKDYRNQAKKVDATTDEMMDLIKSINNGIWDGDAADEYRGRFKKLKDDMNDVYKMIIEYADDLDAVADLYKITEKANDALAGSLKIDL